MTTVAERECDVLVIGGGPAGIAASIAAARSGADTVLIEQNPSPGGNVFHSKVHTICGLFRNDTSHPEPLHRGLTNEFAGELIRQGGARAPKPVGEVFVLPMYPKAFCDLARTWLEGEQSLSMSFNTRLQSIQHTRSGWQAVTKNVQENNRVNWSAKIVLDTSGDAVAVQKAGASCLQSPLEELQIPSYIIKLSGMPDEYLDGFNKLRVHHHLAKGVKEGTLPDGCESVLIRPGANTGTGYMTLNMPRKCDGTFDPFDPSSVKKYEKMARDRAEQIISLLGNQNDEFHDLQIDQHPQRIGIRETRRIKGRQIINEEAVLEGTRSPNGVARSAWPIELWHSYESPKFVLPDAYCDIPLGSLVSNTFPDLGAAGRCMSATHSALGALRVIGTAMATGEALGIAAASATSSRDLTSVNPEHIRAQKENEFDNTLRKYT